MQVLPFDYGLTIFMFEMLRQKTISIGGTQVKGTDSVPFLLAQKSEKTSYDVDVPKGVSKKSPVASLQTSA